MGLPEGVVALLAALFGGAGLKLIEKLLGKAKERADVASEIREELREDLDATRTLIGTLRHELAKEREVTLQQSRELAKLHIRMTYAISHLRAIIEEVENFDNENLERRVTSFLDEHRDFLA